MNFAATLLFATASASATYGAARAYAQPAYQQQAYGQAYAQPAYEPKTLQYTKSYSSEYKKIDVDAIVTELNKRNEAPIRVIRDETFAQTQALTQEHRDLMDEVIAAFEADILGLREAIQMSRDNKRAEISAANSEMRSLQDAIISGVNAELARLNEAQETLLAEILLADMYYDHTRIAKLLDNDGKAEALTWEEDVRPAAETVADSYLSWNARDEPAERHYNEYYSAKQEVPYYGYGY